MKKKVFKFRIIGLLVFLFGLFISILFGYGISAEYSNQENGTYRYWILSFAILVFLLNHTSLILLIKKSVRTVFFLNVLYLLLLGLIVFGFIRKQIYLQIEIQEYDIGFTSIGSMILIFLIFAINRFKFKEVQYENIDFIGKNQE